MKKADLLALIQSLPDDADIQVEESERYDTNEITSVIPATEYRNWWSKGSMRHAVENNIWVLLLE